MSQAPQATPRWSDFSHAYGVSAFVAYDVQADSSSQALGAVPYTAGNTFEKDAALTAEQPEARTNGGPRTWIVGVKFSPANANAQQKDRNKPQIQWWRQVSREAVDADADGNPITNSAGDPFDPPPEKEFGERGFSIFRYEKSYDLLLAESFEDSVNDAAVTLLGRYKFRPLQLKFDSYLPTGRVAYDATEIEMEYRFSIRRDQVPNAKVSPWDWRLIDQGRAGWGQDSNGKLIRQPFTFKKTNQSGGVDQVTENVLLNGFGVPVDTDSYRVGAGRLTANANPRPLPAAIVERAKNGVAFIRPKKFRRMPFQGLHL